MWKPFWTAAIGATVAIVTASAQGTTPGKRPADVIVIGCLESAQSEFAIRDYRSGVRYRLEATAEMLGWHVGHELEIQGTIQSGSSATPTLKVETLVYLSQTCSPPSGGKSN
jgi:hypothetical protein